MILGTLVDLQTIAIEASEVDGVSVSRLNHSLPATNPELVVLAMVSVEANNVAGILGTPVLFSPGGNASFVTFGYAVMSTPTVTTFAFEAASIVFHSLIR